MVRLIVLAVFGVLLPSTLSQLLQSSRSCQANNCQCKDNYIPFCGTDDVTYRNKCFLECNQRQCNSGLRVKFEGVCPEKYVHNDGTGVRNIPQASNTNFVTASPNFRRVQAAIQVNQPGFSNQRHTQRPSFDFERSTQRPSFDFGRSTQRPSFDFGRSTQRPSFEFDRSTQRQIPSFDFERSTQRQIPSFEFSRSTQRPSFEFGRSTKRPTVTYERYDPNTTRRPSFNNENEATTRRSSANYYTTTRRSVYESGINNNDLFGGNRESNEFANTREGGGQQFEFVGGNRQPNQFGDRGTNRIGGGNRGQLSNYGGGNREFSDYSDY